jgi:hypothetical protein
MVVSICILGEADVFSSLAGVGSIATSVLTVLGFSVEFAFTLCSEGAVFFSDTSLFLLDLQFVKKSIAAIANMLRIIN